MIAGFDDDVANFVETYFAIEHIYFVMIVDFFSVVIEHFVIDKYFFL